MQNNIIDSQKIIDHLKNNLTSIRTGRVTSSVLDIIEVEAYGTNMKIIELATVTVPEPTQLMITPFDKSLIPNIAKAITTSNLGVSPSDDGAGIRLNFPPLTTESRAQKVKEVGKELEESRIMMRSVRQDILKTEKRKKENDEISEDELKNFETQLQKEIDELNKKLQEIAKHKEDELMTV
jgi:ribosome recycling factor